MLTDTAIGLDWLVTATVSHKNGAGWIGCRQIPAFILPGDTLGIVSEAHARKIAESMLAEIAGDTLHSLSVTVTPA
jgi:hypothetical protein